MNWKYKELPKLLKNSLHGLERECLRVDQKGNISQKPHPKAFGEPLTHPNLTTDFAEAQLELITPPSKSDEEARNFLRALHCFINKNNPDELIWPFSMPPRLPNEKDIKIAQYGQTNRAKKRTKYREGLAARYGKKMQTVSGTHYNFSFSKEFWRFLYKKTAPKNQSEKDFISESYLKLMRNFLRIAWINTYLFGAAPAIDKTYLKSKPAALKRHGWNTYYGPYATSIRMSNLGYYSKVQSQLNISYNSLGEYLEALEHAVKTKSEAYKGFPGINENLLQSEAEHYSRIRPKCPPKNHKETAIQAIKERGIQYIEVRTLDINPFATIGIAKHQIRFLHICLLYCLFKPSPKITPAEAKIIRENQNLVAIYGRQPDLKLQTARGEKPFKTLAANLLKDLEEFAHILDQTFKNSHYTDSLSRQKEKLENPALLPSARLIETMLNEKKSFVELGLQLANDNKPHLDFCVKTAKCKVLLEGLVEQSIRDEKQVQVYESVKLENYEDLETSTQTLIRQAQKRGIDIEILDRHESVIRLVKGRIRRIVMKATMTEKDSIISYFLMADKELSKIILRENDISVPNGRAFHDLDTALAYKLEKPTIVKPASTNFGIGVSLVQPNQPKEYEKALKEAFSHGDSVIVEDFISGKEYRLLVIGDKTVAVCHRIPANVIGDGKSTISQLIDHKNAAPYSYKFISPQYHIRKSNEEKTFLKAQKLTLTSIPKKGQQIFLRENSNVSTGGDPLDYTNQVHQFYKDIALRAARSASARFCGVDMIIKDITKPGEYSIIEINFNPALHIHCFYQNGSGPDYRVADLTLDELGF
ncbi:glutamate--cysteine ligase [Candidatus Gracilibacteria bacterium]|nr:glutamate--cysteine ligase [Candidatus Gracilibacteria bacterium]